MIHYNDPQQSEGWFASRRGVITGSRFKDCRGRLKNGEPDGKCIAYARDVARERVGGKVPAVFANAAMRFGTEQEPFARRAYEAATRRFVEEVGFITDDDRIFGVSLDGMIDQDGTLEVKTLVSSDVLFTVLGGDISAYLDQIDGGLWMTGRKWCDLVLWAPDLEPIGRHLTIIRIERNEARIQALEDDLARFAKMVDSNESLLRGTPAPAIAAPASPQPAVVADWKNEFLNLNT